MMKFDSNKAIGAICAVGLVYLFAKWGASSIYVNKPESIGEHGAGYVQAYSIDTGVAASSGGEVEAINPAIFLAQADAGNGESVFKKCSACHKMNADATGPMLGRVFGAAAGSEEGYSYSKAMLESGLTWDAETLFTFLGDVKGTVKGTKMTYPGIKDEQDRADLIAFLGGDAFDASAFAAAAEETTNAPAEEAAPEAEAAPDAETTEPQAEAAPAETAVASLPVGDASNGENVFKKCKACHAIQPGKNGTGPSLAGIVGKPAGAAEGFKYSKAMAESGLTWDEATLFKFLGDVRGTVKGTRMAYPGIKKEQDRADLIAYLAAN